MHRILQTNIKSSYANLFDSLCSLLTDDTILTHLSCEHDEDIGSLIVLNMHYIQGSQSMCKMPYSFFVLLH